MPILSPPPGPPPGYVTTFVADAMFFHSAKDALENATRATKRITRAEFRLERQQQKLRAATRAADDDPAAFDEAESLAIQMESYEYEVVEAYGPLLQQLALVHILSASSLEAHINLRADMLLGGREWKTFERLAIDAKWLFLPKILGLQGFDVGAQPFQGFDGVISARNALMHYKPQKEPCDLWFDDPSGFAKRLRLTFDACQESLQTVEGMIAELARQLGEKDGPWWLRMKSRHFFETTREK